MSEHVFTGIHPPDSASFCLCCRRYCLEKEEPGDYVLCDVIGQTGADSLWRRECFRVVGDAEKPLMLQSLWKPKEGFARRFEIQLRASVREQSLKDRDTVTAGTTTPALGDTVESDAYQPLEQREVAERSRGKQKLLSLCHSEGPSWLLPPGLWPLSVAPPGCCCSLCARLPASCLAGVLCGLVPC